jgi:FecR protein
MTHIDSDHAYFRAWPAALPTPGFASRVAVRAVAERATRRRVRRAAGAGVLAVAAALVAVYVPFGAPSAGEVDATQRRSVAIGTRGVAVLEPGAHVSWHGEEVKQDRGEVFYRIEPGGGFSVETPVGSIVVRGTCFRVRLDDDGARVDDLEGHVEVRRSGSMVALGPGASATLDAGGVHEAPTRNRGARAAAVNLLAAEGERLAALEHENAELRTRLARRAEPDPAIAPPAATPARVAVPFELGNVGFAPGDAITITSVTGDRSTLEVGGVYHVEGTWHLESQPSATLALFVTNGKAEGPASLHVEKGEGTFSIDVTRLTRAGYPHVSFYPTSGGASFGGAYFGTGDSVYRGEYIPGSDAP